MTLGEGRHLPLGVSLEDKEDFYSQSPSKYLLCFMGLSWIMSSSLNKISRLRKGAKREGEVVDWLMSHMKTEEEKIPRKSRG